MIISQKFKRRLLGIVLFAGIMCLAPNYAFTQSSLLGGLNISNMRNNDILENEKIGSGFHFGWALRYHPLKILPDFSIQNQIIYSRKGYRQVFEKSYMFQFDYIAFPVLLNYSINKIISVNMGIEISRLVRSNVENALRTYNNLDFGFVIGFSCFDHKRISGYSEVTYGITPMLDYYIIDSYGNFTGEIHDLKNLCISFGVKLNIYNEKIFLFK